MARRLVVLAIVLAVIGTVTQSAAAQGNGGELPVISPVAKDGLTVHYCTADSAYTTASIVILPLPTVTFTTPEVPSAHVAPRHPPTRSDRPEPVVRVEVVEAEHGAVHLVLEGAPGATVALYAAAPSANRWLPLMLLAVEDDGTTSLELGDAADIAAAGGLALLLVAPDVAFAVPEPATPQGAQSAAWGISAS